MPNPCSTSRVSHSDFEAIVQSNSSPASIAASLNEAEATASRSHGTSHGNAKRVYPWWKTCQHCSQPFPCLTRAQATRNQTCSRACAAGVMLAKRPSRAGQRDPAAWVTLTCSECGSTFERRRAWVRDPESPMCSRRCNGKARARALLAHPDFARGKTSPDAIAKRSAKMRGSNNPAWKGGAMLKGRKGNYTTKERLVRCPPALAVMARSNGYVLEHRLVVALAIGRPLFPAEAVHHVNHDPTDNRAENLMLFESNAAHKRHEAHGSPSPIWSGSSA